MHNEYLHLTPAKWQELNPPSKGFLRDFLNFKIAKYIENNQQLNLFLQDNQEALPFIIGVSGSVAGGKSTFAKKIQKILKELYPTKKVKIVSTDSFLMSNQELESKHLMDQKGFPNSVNWGALINFLKAVKNGKDKIPIRIYSQEISDLVPNKLDLISKNDIVILEGINVLELPTSGFEVVSDYLDLAIYLESSEEDLENWFMLRYHKMLEINKDNPDNFFYEWAHKPQEESDNFAHQVWRDVNLKNLHEYIAPSKVRADLIVKKQANHEITDFYIKKK